MSADDVEIGFEGDDLDAWFAAEASMDVPASAPSQSYTVSTLASASVENWKWSGVGKTLVIVANERFIITHVPSEGYKIRAVERDRPNSSGYMQEDQIVPELQKIALTPL